jgi:hypothetical protein
MMIGTHLGRKAVKVTKDETVWRFAGSEIIKRANQSAKEWEKLHSGHTWI